MSQLFVFIVASSQNVLSIGFARPVLDYLIGLRAPFCSISGGELGGMIYCRDTYVRGLIMLLSVPLSRLPYSLIAWLRLW